MMNSLLDHFEDIYYAKGIEAQTEAMNKVYEMYCNDREAFNAYLAKYGIDEEAQTIDCSCSDVELWVEEMEEAE